MMAPQGTLTPLPSFSFSFICLHCAWKASWWLLKVFHEYSSRAAGSEASKEPTSMPDLCAHTYLCRRTRRPHSVMVLAGVSPLPVSKLYVPSQVQTQVQFTAQRRWAETSVRPGMYHNRGAWHCSCFSPCTGAQRRGWWLYTTLRILLIYRSSDGGDFILMRCG